MTPSPTPKTPSTPEVEIDKSPVFLKRFPAPIANIVMSTHDRVQSLIRENPLTGITAWAGEKLKKFLPFLFGEKKPVTATPPPAPAAAPSVPPSAPAPEVSVPATAVKEAPEGPAAELKAPSELFQRANEAERRKMSLITEDFAKITQQLRPSMKRSDTLDAMAQSRMKTMKETGILAHDDAYLQQNKCAENILSGNYDSGEAIAKAFMASPDESHPRNMMGSYKNFGIAMDRVLAKEKNKETGQIEEKWLYFFVVLYNDGVKDEKAPLVRETVPSIPNSAASVDLFPFALAALEESAKEAGLEISHEANPELTKTWVSAEELSKGTAVETFQTADGKKVNYLVRKNPPTLTHLGDRGPMSKEMLFSEFIGHFKQAIAIPTASELEQQAAMPSAAEASYGMENAQKEEESAIVNPS